MMIGELAAGLVLALAVTWYVMAPVLRPSAARAGAAMDLDDEEDLSPRTRALRALKEIEFDRATGKLADGDYEELKAQYTAEALVAMREGEAGGEPAAQPTTPPARSGGASRAVVCPVDGPRPESDAEFCSACGRRLATAPGFCRQCGAALEVSATFCNACGVRVAA